MPVDVVDSHHHLWSLTPTTGAPVYPWLKSVAEGGVSSHVVGDVARLKQDYLLDDYLRDANNGSCRLIKSVHVQAEAENACEEVKFLERIANGNADGFPHGIVAHANLASSDLPDLLDTYTREHPRVKGVRQLINWSDRDPRLSMTDRGDYLTDPTWIEGFQLLTSHSLSFDMHVYPSQMIDAANIARQYPQANIILDHCGLPADGPSGFSEWQQGIQHLAAQPNVSCKLSGLVMFNHQWSKEIFAPYLVECLRSFTPKRCMFGSNFPVDKVHASFEELVNVYRDIAENEAGLICDELDMIFRENAIRVYRL